MKNLWIAGGNKYNFIMFICWRNHHAFYPQWLADNTVPSFLLAHQTDNRLHSPCRILQIHTNSRSRCEMGCNIHLISSYAKKTKLWNCFIRLLCFFLNMSKWQNPKHRNVGYLCNFSNSTAIRTDLGKILEGQNAVVQVSVFRAGQLWGTDWHDPPPSTNTTPPPPNPQISSLMFPTSRCQEGLVSVENKSDSFPSLLSPILFHPGGKGVAGRKTRRLSLHIVPL